tara:strand:- start:3920 stop:4750 length:831 start_codon:yes stop_codon:yes gene_type:complete
MKFCHIAPVPHLDLVRHQQTHLTLAHIAETDEDYCTFYAGLPSGTVNIMDNSGFEMYKAGLPNFPPEALIPLANKVNADYIVIPDYPDMPSIVGIDDARRYAPAFKEAGFGTFFVPQSTKGDLEDLIISFAFAASNPLIDYIGISILAVPNAYSCEKGNNLQRYMARWKFMNELKSRGLLQLAKDNDKLIHFLGMVDGPNEIALCRDFGIDTWDSSAAIWAGFNGVEFDNSPTGLFNGKFEKHVDFQYETEDNTAINLAKHNMDYIDNLVIGVNQT